MDPPVWGRQITASRTAKKRSPAVIANEQPVRIGGVGKPPVPDAAGPAVHTPNAATGLAPRVGGNVFAQGRVRFPLLQHEREQGRAKPGKDDSQAGHEEQLNDDVVGTGRFGCARRWNGSGRRLTTFRAALAPCRL